MNDFNDTGFSVLCDWQRSRMLSTISNALMDRIAIDSRNDTRECSPGQNIFHMLVFQLRRSGPIIANREKSEFRRKEEGKASFRGLIGDDMPGIYFVKRFDEGQRRI